MSGMGAVFDSVGRCAEAVCSMDAVRSSRAMMKTQPVQTEGAAPKIYLYHCCKYNRSIPECAECTGHVRKLTVYYKLEA